MASPAQAVVKVVTYGFRGGAPPNRGYHKSKAEELKLDGSMTIEELEKHLNTSSMSGRNVMFYYVNVEAPNKVPGTGLEVCEVCARAHACMYVSAWRGNLLFSRPSASRAADWPSARLVVLMQHFHAAPQMCARPGTM